MPRSVIILPHFVLTKIAPICNNNESHLVNSIQRGFIGISNFQVPPVKIYQLGYSWQAFPRKAFVYNFSKAMGWRYPTSLQINKGNIFDSFETHLGSFYNYVTLKIEFFASQLLICVLWYSTLQNSNLLFLICRPLFLIEFFVRKISDRRETLKGKIQQSEQKKWKKKNYQTINWFEIYCIFIL